MFFRSEDGNYLTCEMKLSKERKGVALIKEECVSAYISRFRLLQHCQSYLSSNDGNNIVLCNKDDDSTLFLKHHDCYENIFGKKLEFQFERVFLNQFQERGYIIFRNAIPEQITDSARTKILEKVETRISNLFELDQELFTLILKTPILKVILDEVFREESYHLTTYSSNTLRFNKDDEIYFHVDYPYGLNHDLGSRNCEFELLGVQVIIPLNDFSIENGATLFIGKDKKVNYFIAPKGSLIIYRADLVHSQGINKTQNPRVGLLANFASIFVKAKDNIVDYASKTGLEIRDGKVFI
jgi:hypothetical protein